MTLHTHTRARGLTVLRAAAMFDGASSSLTADPAVVIEDGQILAVHTAANPIPDRAQIVSLPGAACGMAITSAKRPGGGTVCA